MAIDLHTHSRVSDGTDSPTELVAKAVAAGLTAMALTDHDTFDGLDEAQAAAEASGLDLVRGLEMSTKRGAASVHLLGYLVDESDPELTAELVRVRAGRGDRLAPVLEKLAALGVAVTEQEVLAQVGDSPSIGRPHIADALVAAGHVADRREAFDRFLADGGPAHVERYATPLERGIELIKAAGGVAVIAHPWSRGHRPDLPEEYLASLVPLGLDGIEVDHVDHDPETRVELRALADRLGLLATGSSDHHGLGKVGHPLGVNTTSPEVLAEIRRRAR